MSIIYISGESKINKILPLIIIILFVSSFSDISIAESSNNIIYVDDDGGADYTKIQDAIDNASDGDTIFVYNGTYYENVIIDKTIFLVGENRNSTTIDANQSGSVVLILSDNVDISGFTLQNSGNEFWNSGVEIKSKECRIDNNIIRSNHQGIVIHHKKHGNTISNNIITENRLNQPYNAAGIDCMSSDSTMIYKNMIYKNNGSGLDIHGSDSLHFIDNIVKMNKGSGVRYTNCAWGKFIRNIFIENEGHGLEFSCSWNECSSVRDNTFISNNKTGLYFCDNGCPEIIENNFIDNGRNAYFSYFDLNDQEAYPCIWKNNYWDDWIGIGPKIIWGALKRSSGYSIRKIPYPNVDWRPARKPYDFSSTDLKSDLGILECRIKNNRLYLVSYNSYLKLDINTSALNNPLLINEPAILPVTIEYWTNIPDFYTKLPFRIRNYFLFGTFIGPLQVINLDIQNIPDLADIYINTSIILVNIPYEGDVKEVITDLTITITDEAPKESYRIDIIAECDDIKRLNGCDIQWSLEFTPG